MCKIYCECCGNVIPEHTTDGASVRLKIGEDHYIYYYSGDEEAEPDGRHYCQRCIVGKLESDAEDDPLPEELLDQATES